MSLHLELREQIWRDALPDNPVSALYSYRKGYWRPGRCPTTNEEYNAVNDENDYFITFRHDLLEEIGFDVLMLVLNREARRIALA